MTKEPFKICTPCCNYTPRKDLPWPVMWNEFSKCVQCHNCGIVYMPVSLMSRSYKKKLPKKKSK